MWAGLAALALLLCGCSAGQLAQTSEQSSAVNGTHGRIGDLDLRNVFLHGEPVGPDTNVYRDTRLAFTIVNTSETATDRLVSIASPKASVNLQAPADTLELRPGTSLAAGEPVEQLATPSAPDEKITVPVTIQDPTLVPGLTAPFDFTFEHAGTITLQVPFDVWTAGEPHDSARPLPPDVTP
ncbi:hypothetical protein [Nocardia donostiensis]|uniref:Copper chaperone PCu(A)C n=1 Tax=Nocardia donostiensis TaxID=1538463 RepID=A0A1V2TIV5_9NOCA|nr:hypothetical protein [Nocardia donostiensis]ONM49281.1 hypothetical protein B0T46_07800 [Nocardia donostiensis]OQS14801.1 hypothetical protein B0T36_12060 [Nocardia donostiensis]OQS21804.1 hypothetical protein B0T44_06755 [Nocardia donostiensis]